MTQRIGVPALMRVARQMCKYIVLFTPAIQRTYPSNSALLAALAAANAACGVLASELQTVREYGD